MCQWVNNIKIYLQEVECGSIDGIELVQNRFRWSGTCVCGNEHSGSIKCGAFLD